jgi:hypothetical protein
MTAAQQNSVQPALDALTDLRADVLERIGKGGGNLNGKLKANFNVIEATLISFSTITTMSGTIGQQTQLVSKVINDMSQQISRLRLPAATGDDGTSDTKGE